LNLNGLVVTVAETPIAVDTSEYVWRTVSVAFVALTPVAVDVKESVVGTAALT
jgi:hypothetical protein